MSKILVTGAAGFIGFHCAKRLLELGHGVVGLDSISDYHDPALKMDRLKQLRLMDGFRFVKLDLADRQAVPALFEQRRFEKVLHLAAQAGVRYSVTNPHAFVDSNLQGFLNVLEGCRHSSVRHLVFASSSSVYGANTRMPFSVHHNVDHPVSLYAASKKANELMAHSYAHLYRLPVTGLRFFTVYGPWGRPDMALFIFTKAILEDREIEVFNRGQLQRDFTYIDDIVEGVVRVLEKPAGPDHNWSSDDPDPHSSQAPYRIYNIGGNQPVNLLDFIGAIEVALGKKARKKLLPMQLGDMRATCADSDDLQRDFGFSPSTPLQEGVQRFVDWYRSYYGTRSRQELHASEGACLE